MTTWHFTFGGEVRAETAKHWHEARRLAARHFRCGEQDVVTCGDGPTFPAWRFWRQPHALQSDEWVELRGELKEARRTAKRILGEKPYSHEPASPFFAGIVRLPQSDREGAYPGLAAFLDEARARGAMEET